MKGAWPFYMNRLFIPCRIKRSKISICSSYFGDVCVHYNARSITRCDKQCYAGDYITADVISDHLMNYIIHNDI